jgi:hypothetical protein
VEKSSPDAPLRVFTLGIGEEVSSAVVEGIARAGNGESLFAVEVESIESKCVRLLRAGRFPCVESVSIDWGIQESSQNNTFLDSFAHLQPGPAPGVLQSPTQIRKIFPGMRFTVFSLTTHKAIPKQVILRGKLNGAGGQIMIVVPVSRVRMFRGMHPLLVHTLTACHLINDLVEGRMTLPRAINPTIAEDTQKAAVIWLGEKYQLASRYTSFIAVQGETDMFRPQLTDDQSEVSEEIPVHTGWQSGAYSDASSSSNSPSPQACILDLVEDEQEINSVGSYLSSDANPCDIELGVRLCIILLD